MASLRNLFLPAILISPLLFSSVSWAETQKDKEPSRSTPVQDIYHGESANVEVSADQLEYDRDHKKVIAKGNVVVHYQGMQITADYGEVHTEAKQVHAKGHVLVLEGESPKARGHEVFYDFGNESGSFPNGKSIELPWYSSGEDLRQLRKGLKVAKKASVTTCDLEKPHYEIRAKKVTLYEGDKLIAQNVTIHVLGKPIFWWPYLIIPLQKKSHPPLVLNTGYSSKHGYYVESRKGISLTEKIWGKVRADWRSKRGFGGGSDLDYDYGRFAQGSVKAYLTQDRRAPTVSRDNPFSQLEKRLRGRVTLRNRSDLDDSTFLVMRYNRFADAFFLQDFFEKEYRSEIEPQSFVSLTRNAERYSVLAHVEKRVNRFESPVERLPQVRFNWKNQPFFNSGVYYQGELSFDNLAKRFGYDPYDEDVVRTDQFNEWSVPLRWKNIQLTPFASLRGTYYSREKESDEDRFRTAFGQGVDLRTQFYRTFSVPFHPFGIESGQLRHVVEPSIRLDAAQSTVSDETLNHFDTIDKIDDAHRVTFGLENRLQTKRMINGRMQRVDIVSLNSFLSYEFHPDGQSRSAQFTTFDNGPTKSGFTILSQEVLLRPYDWLFFQIQTDYDMNRDSFRVFNQDLLVRWRRLRALFGNRYIKDIGAIRGSNQFVFQGQWTVNPKWELVGYIRWDQTSGKGLEEWQVSAIRDLHDFILRFGYNVRNSSIASANKELFFTFYLKAFPQYDLHSGQEASFSEPRIGETVAGASQFSGPLFTYKKD